MAQKIIFFYFTPKFCHSDIYFLFQIKNMNSSNSKKNNFYFRSKNRLQKISDQNSIKNQNSNFNQNNFSVEKDSFDEFSDSNQISHKKKNKKIINFSDISYLDFKIRDHGLIQSTPIPSNNISFVHLKKQISKNQILEK